MKTKLIGLSFVISIASMHVSWSADGDVKLAGNIKPSLLHSSKEDSIVPAVKWKASLRYDSSTELRAYGVARTEGVLATAARAHSEALFAEIAGGVVFHPIDLQPPEVFTGDARETTGLGDADRDYGRLDIGMKLRFEADQLLENYNLTYGAEIGYVLPSDRGWQALVPSLYVSYERVEVLESQFFDVRGIADDPFLRFGVASAWKWRPFAGLVRDLELLNPIALHADVRSYYSHDLPTGASQADQRWALYYAGTISYEFTDIGTKWMDKIKLRNVYVTAARGRLPPATRDQTMVYVGVVLGGPLKKAN
jgi:hypothetical protein